MEEWQKKLADNYDKMVVKDDGIIYESNCLACGGRCCIDQEILVNPYDVWRIVHNERVSDLLGIKTSHDLYTSDNSSGKPLLRYYLGPSSRLPLACINMREIDKETKVCPFNSPIKALKDYNDFRKFRNGRYDEIDYLKSAEGNPSLLCIIDEVKPTICRAFPLGRAGLKRKDDNHTSQEFPEMEYILMDDANCKKFRVPDKKMTVREYINKWNLDHLYQMSDLVKDWHEYLLKEVKNEKARYVAGIPMYDFDVPGLTKAGGKPDPQIIKEVRPPDFKMLVQINQKIITRILKDRVFPGNR